MNQAFHLFQLQKVDTKIMEIVLRIQEIEKMISSDSRLKEAEAILKNARVQIDKLNKKLREAEEIGKEIRVEIELNEGSLYSGKIRNPKELNDIQNKVASDKKRFKAVEEDQLDWMMQIEDKEKELSQLEALMVDVQSKVATSHAQLQGEKSKLVWQKATLDTERNAKLNSVSKPEYEIYLELLKKKN